MKIAVTGANGYLGQGIVKELLEMGQEVVAVDFTTDNVDSRAEQISGNILEADDPYEQLGCPDVLLHLAWRDGFVHNSNAHVEDLPKHYEFIKKVAESGISRMAIMGSMHEVGFFEGAIKDDTSCNPQSLYGIAKNALRGMTELICKNNNVKLQWLRGYYIVGNTSYGSSIFSKIAAAAKENKKEFPFTMGLNQFDFIDYDLFCQMVAKTVVQEQILGNINICSGRPEKLADRVERFIKENGFDIKLQYGKFPDRPYDSKAVWGDNTKIQQIMQGE